MDRGPDVVAATVDSALVAERVAAVRERMTAELLMHLACVWAKGPFFYDRHGTKALEAKFAGTQPYA